MTTPTENDRDARREARALRRQGRRGIVGPLILVVIGILFLLSNFGYLSSSFWLTAIQFWPLILILVGLEILLGHSWQGQVVVLILALLAFGVVVWLTINPGVFPIGGGTTTTTIDASSDGVNAAELELSPGIGNLDLHALTAADSDWIKGTITYPNSQKLNQDSSVANATAHLKLTTSGNTPFFNSGSESWDLGLNPAVPVRLSVNSGVGNTTLDLNALNVPQVDVDAGVGNVTVTLPAHAGSVSSTINGGVGTLTVLIPQGVPARIRLSSGVGGANVNQTRFPQAGKNTYESADFSTATDKVDVSVDAGVGGINIP